MVSLNRGRIIVLSTTAKNFNNICILHLSDLHIVCRHKDSYGNQLQKLIDDIVEQTRTLKKILLVVSGDIIDKGNYDEKNIRVAEKFFTNLYEKLGDKIVDLIMTPGNHDKHRDNIHELISWGVRYKNELVKEEEWEYFKEAYSGFISLYNTLLKKFYNKDNPIKNTYGVHKVELNNQIVLFVRLDTAWSSFSKNDSYLLSFGEYQKEKLLDEYQAIRDELKGTYDEKDIITIGISHFPVNLLKSEDEGLCNKIFLSKNGLDLDLLLCGHVHDASLSHYFNHEHSLLTLVTGIGNIDDNSPRDEHRYSIYVLNLHNNSCDIIMRKSSMNNYAYDYSIYTEKKNIEENKLVYPIRVSESHAFIKLHCPDPINKKSKFLDSNLLSLIPDVSKILYTFIQFMTDALAHYKARVFDELRAPWLDKNGEYVNAELNELASNIYDYFFVGGTLTEYEKKELYYDNTVINFSGYLIAICDKLNYLLKKLFSKETIIRTHFRVYDKENNLYRSIQWQTDEKVEKSQPRSIEWSPIMKAAYCSGESIQFSANQELNEFETPWDDFLTIVPKCVGNEIEVLVDKTLHEYEKRPCLTFGLSIKSTKQTDFDILSILVFLRLEYIIKRVLDAYIETFNIELGTSLNELLESEKEKAGINNDK